MFQHLLYIFLFTTTLSASPVGTAWEIPQDVEVMDGYDMPINPLEGRESVLETHSITGRGFQVHAVRNKRSPTYHVLQSPGLTSHFDVEENEARIKGTAFWSRVGKRSPADDMENVEEFMENYAINVKPRQRRAAVDNIENEEVATGKTDGSEEKQAARQSRGTSRDQWVKQPLPVEYPNLDDQETAAAINEGIIARAPRVNFVTTKKLDTAESRDQRDSLQRTPNSKPYLRTDIYPTYTDRRSYDYPENRRRYYEDPYYYSDNRRGDDRYYNRYDSKPYDRYSNRNDYDYYASRSSPNQTRQRRIIYYDTLPDVTRSPPSVDFRYRSYGRPEYYDRFDYDRYERTPYYNNNRRYNYRPSDRPRDYLQAANVEQTKGYSDKPGQHRVSKDQKFTDPVKLSTSLNIRDDKPSEHRFFVEAPGKGFDYSQPPSFQEVNEDPVDLPYLNNRRT